MRLNIRKFISNRINKDSYGIFLQFFYREFKSRYVGSISGLLWVLIQPVMLLAVYSYVFSVIFKIKFPELQSHSFLSFVTVALWPWLAFQESLQRATVSIQNNSAIVKKIYLRQEVFVYASVLSAYAVHTIGFLLILIALAVFGEPIRFALLPVFLVVFLLQIVFSLALSFVMATLQVFLRDVEHILSPVLMLWFYLTPILYPVSLIPDSLRFIVWLNPMAYFIDQYRNLLLLQEWSMDGWGLLAVATTIIALIAGRRFFQLCSGRFEEFI